MNNMNTFFLLPIAVAAGLMGCAAPNQQPYYGSSPAPSQSYPAQNYPAQAQSYQLGYVDKIEVITRSARDNVAGTIIGGIIGGIIGTQIGSGRGRTVATIAGVVGGAAAGNVIEGRRRADHETFRVTVRFDNGSLQTITQEDINDLQTGDRVRLDGNMISRM